MSDDKDLSKLIQQKASRHSAPPALVARIQQISRNAATAARPAQRVPWWTLPWLQLGGAFALGCLVMLLCLPLHPASATEDATIAQLVDGHVRSLQPGHLTDMPSTDQHAVKPWFSGRLDFTPPVQDFAEAGFTLAGGRLDVVDGRSVAALVYRRNQHVINVFVSPGQGKPAAPIAKPGLRGFNIVRWSNGNMVCWAVSDLNATELARFAEAFWRGAA